ncbi:hypothetical protein [Candidatus Methylacidithermus pantelleriae]|nr:hypothetical protein [Candidatus Methylacidithermus pantelleriae]
MEIESDPGDSHAFIKAVRFGQGEMTLVRVDADRSGKAVCHPGNGSAPRPLANTRSPSSPARIGSFAADPFRLRRSFPASDTRDGLPGCF